MARFALPNRSRVNDPTSPLPLAEDMPIQSFVVCRTLEYSTTSITSPSTTGNGRYFPIEHLSGKRPAHATLPDVLSGQQSSGLCR